MVFAKKTLLTVTAFIIVLCLALGFVSCGSASEDGEDNDGFMSGIEDGDIPDSTTPGDTASGNTGDEEDGDYELCYELSSDGEGYTVTGLTAGEGYVSIPSSHDGLPVTGIAVDAFRGCDVLTGVRIPSSVTEIGNCAFYDCAYLVEIWFDAASMLDISSTENGIFQNSGAMADGITLTIGASATRVPGYLFSPSNDLTVSPNITEIVFEDGSECEEIGSGAFRNLPYVTSMEFPGSLRTLGQSAFYRCTSLENVVLSEGLEVMSPYVFQYCSALSSIAIPSTVKEIGQYAFSGCDSLTDVYITDFSAWCGIDFGTSRGNPVSDGVALHWGDEVVTDWDSMVIPEGTERIGTYAFYGFEFRSLTIPSTVEEIGNYAFYNCYHVEEINFNAAACADQSERNYVFAHVGQEGGDITLNIGAGVTRIPSHMFCPYGSNSSYAPPITDVNFAGGCVCSEIGSYAFERCDTLTCIVLPDSVTSIGNYAFGYCTSLEWVVIPSTVTKIDFYAFTGCSAISAVYYSGTEEEWGGISVDSGNSYLMDAQLYLYSEASPSDSGNWWHYDDEGNPVIW